MPLAHYLRDDHLEIVAAGDYTPQEIQEIYDHVLVQPGCPRPLPVLCVVQESARSASPEEMREIGSVYSRLAGRVGPRIAMAAADDLNFGLCRMFGAHLEPLGYQCETFRAAREGRQWLRADSRGQAEG